MGYDDVLSVLTSFEKGTDNDTIIKETIDKTMHLLSEEDKKLVAKLWDTLNDDDDVKWKYVLLSIFIVEAIKKVNMNDKDDTFSVKQIQILKSAMEIITLLGLKPNCILYNKSTTEQNELLRKHERLVYVTNFFTGCFDDFLLKTCVLTHLGIVLTSLFFVSNAVFKPPKTNQTLEDKSDSNMTPELYAKLKTTQMEIKMKLSQTMEKCPITLVMKELMVIHGTMKFPKFMRIPAKRYLIQYIMRPSGVMSFILTMCNEDEITNIANHWQKLEIAAKLLATSHGDDPEEYYNSVCSQIIELLKTSNFNQSVTIVKTCIKSLDEYNRGVCIDKILKIIAAPFFPAKNISESEKILWSEQNITESIELLSRCFISDESEFKQLSLQLLRPITLPIFLLYVKSVTSISSLKQKIKQLSLRIFSQNEIREELFALFLNYNKTFSFDYGAKLHFQLGDSGNFEIVHQGEELDREKLSNALFELVSEEKTLAFDLFNFLLKSLPLLEESSTNILETESDVIDRIERLLSSVNLLVKLANLSIIQKSNLEHPENLLSFVKSLIVKRKSEGYENTEENNSQVDISYIGLLLIKVILEESKGCEKWTLFEEFVTFLRGKDVINMIPVNSKKIIDEITVLVQTKNNIRKKNWQDFSINKEKSEFEKAKEDLADPLLPVRAHGQISLTRLIEKKDPETLANKDLLVYLFQINLSHEDSFIYLTAINGLCALVLQYPQSVIEILIQEFINMPQRTSKHELSPENRAKIGEILVKATRNLGEMASAHKTALINGFLCAVRDPDSMVRASSLSCLGELCKILSFRLGSVVEEVIYCIGCIIQHDKAPECRRAAVLVITLLLRGLGKDVLSGIDSKHLLNVYRSLKFLRDNDEDDIVRLHAQLGLEEIDDIVRNHLFIKPKLEKRLFLIPN